MVGNDRENSIELTLASFSRHSPTTVFDTALNSFFVEAVGRVIAKLREQGDGRLFDQRVFGVVGTQGCDSAMRCLTSDHSLVTFSFLLQSSI